MSLALLMVGSALVISWSVALNERVVARFSGALFQTPAFVYAAPLELYEGKALSMQQLHDALIQAGYRSAQNLDQTGLFARQGQRVAIHRRGYIGPQGQVDPRILHLNIVDGQIDQLTDVRGEPLGIDQLEPVFIGHLYPNVREQRELVSYESIKNEAPLLIETLLAVEDRGFFEHSGVSPTAIARAFLTNLLSGGRVQGGSTITQQLAKNFFLTPERSYQRKAAELIMALLMEWQYPKEKILEGYLNEVYLGQSGAQAIHGFGTAARFYFARPINELQAHELALLVGMVKGASFYNPHRHPERALARRNVVIDVMAANGLISLTEADELKARPLGVVEQGQMRARHPAFLNLVRRQLSEQYDRQALQTQGLRIFTSMDLAAQTALEQATSKLDLVEKNRGLPAGSLQTAGVIASVRTGEIHAVLGGRDPGFAGFDRALDSRRQIGSLIKPVIYLEALRQPQRYHWLSTVLDEPLTVTQAGSEDWQPRNFDRQFKGEITLLDALVDSRNVPAVRLGLDLGLDRVGMQFETLAQRPLGQRFPAMLLGSVQASPLEVTQLYHSLSADGFVTPLRAIRAVVDQEGQTLTRYGLEVSQAYDRQSMHLLQYGLEQVVARGTARSLQNHFAPRLRLAGKTGSTNEGRDAWFAGFSGDRVATIWVGRDDNQPANLTGSSSALPIWAAAMEPLNLAPRSDRAPPGVVYRNACLDEGVVVPEHCPGVAVPFYRDYPPPRIDYCLGQSDNDQEKFQPSQEGVFDRLRNWIQ